MPQHKVATVTWVPDNSDDIAFQIIDVFRTDDDRNLSLPELSKGKFPALSGTYSFKMREGASYRVEITAVGTDGRKSDPQIKEIDVPETKRANPKGPRNLKIALSE